MTVPLVQVPCCEPGRPWPMGTQLTRLRERGGLNVCVFAPNARAVVICLYTADGQTETARWRLPERAEGVWYGFVPGITAGQLYGLRADGPWQPQLGHRFNPARLLIDPWARALVGSLDDLVVRSEPRPDATTLPESTDNAAFVPKCRVIDTEAELQAGARIASGPATAWRDTLIYEAHVKSLTRLHPSVEPEHQGSYAAVASPAMLAHYERLGVTSLCLLPVHLHVDERHLIQKGLTNFWGYNSLSFFVPDPRLASRGGAGADDSAVRAEFRQMVDTLHRHGIELILDVVYNHTAESDTQGPTLSWRGLDNAAWYALDGHGDYFNPTGCGNTFDMGQPRVTQLIMDSLRWWVQAFGVDGFRFDLAVTLGRAPELGRNFNPLATLFTAIAQDPVLTRAKLIAEPWDVGPHGYRTGQFNARWHEWNDRFRDTVRAWWLGHSCTRGQFARRLAGSNDLFQGSGRPPTASINLITAHDGFTLADLTAYERKHNEANGEGTQDGHDHNFSANGGEEGPTTDPVILQRRARWRRALLATLFCAQGTPQLLAGDELGHSQRGNNNAYCQDNPTTWLDWSQADRALTAFVSGLASLRQRYPALRHPHWYTGEPVAGAHCPDIDWRNASGTHPHGIEWDIPDGRLLACVITVGERGTPAQERVMLIFHGNPDVTSVSLPGGEWQLLMDSAQGWVAQDGEPARLFTGGIDAAPSAVLMLVQPLTHEPPASS
ncbi:glycogen debranching protein GlgX [Hydrogenophaga sp.]|uniref:glycogen debranching protein GlgX n=1 Tax=Hydrogenophaga sp. TaxID=1904254 RepID=UPI0025C71F45|nr:glycogen debranching protein GlgX [Hydrogenophaga sp.]